jgi:hypothetical protein
MKSKKRLIFYCVAFLCCFVIPFFGFGQVPVKSFTPGMYSEADYIALKSIVGQNKLIPPQYEKQILLALSYFPELVNTEIEFRFKHTNTSFSTVPTATSILQQSGSRKYVITISDSAEKILVPLELKNLPFNAQVGVIGHELSHVADFDSRKLFGLVRIAAGHLSQHFLDRFERRTDSLCIAHGLGYQLLAWSSFIRTTMHTGNWTGSVNIGKGPMLREKYMNPSTIKEQIANNPLYASAY